MSDIIEGIGSAAQGGLFSRALEPDSGAKEPHPHQPENCLNCGTPLTGAYCHACGQAGHLHRTIGGFMHDLVHGAFHFEGKFWRTLPMLVFKPGALTRRYIDGERARFVSPMALFLFGVFLMFAVFQVVGITAPSDLPASEELEQSAIETAQAQIAAKEEQLEDPSLTEEERTQLEGELALLRTFLDEGTPTDRSALEEFLAGVEAGAREGQRRDAVEAGTEGFNEGRAQLGAQGEDAPLERGDTIMQADLTESGNASMSVDATGVEFIDSALSKWRENPSLMLYKMQANAYKFSWLLIPISIPFVWLLFAWKRRFKAYDHAIFITYSLSFVTFLFIAASVLGVAGAEPAIVVLATIFIPPIHMYKQLRGAYGLSRFSAFWRLVVLSGFIWIIVALFVQLLLLLGAF